MSAALPGPKQLDFYSLLPQELAQELGGTGRAKQVWALLRAGKNPVIDPSLSTLLRDRLAQRFALQPATIGQRLQSPGGTVKLQVLLKNKAVVETVVIPSAKRTTVCVSTQVGCARGCVFCATGQMGLHRQLDVGEIVYQINLAQQELREHSLAPVSNVVFMGMGEPLDNFSALTKAIAILIDPHAWRLAPRRLTVSTVGPSPAAILRTRTLPTRLAWSLHAADDDLRRSLIPNLAYPNAVLRDAFAQVLAERRSELLVEMALIKDLNDRDRDIDQLTEFLADLRKQVRINLLPLNPGPAPFSPSPPAQMAHLRKRLQDAGFFCETRRPRGQAIGAACGQLAAGPEITRK